MRSTYLLTIGDAPSQRLIVFSSVILQREKSVNKVRDIVRSLNRRLDHWSGGKFDCLVQEASRCDHPFNTRRRQQNIKEHTKRVFTRLMLLGKVRTAIRWLTQLTKGGILHPVDRAGATGRPGRAWSLPIFGPFEMIIY